MCCSVLRGVKVDLSIIIVSYNTKDVTRECLLSIRHSNLKLEYEIILVDNASTDGTVEMLRTEFPEIYIIANEDNNLFAKANNQGMQVASGANILLLNSDTLVEPGNIEKLHDHLSRLDESVGCVGPTVLNRDGTIQSKGFSLPSHKESLCTMLNSGLLLIPTRWREKILPEGNQYLAAGKRIRDVGWVHGSCFLFPKHIAESLNGLDEWFDFYCEEIDFCKRVQDMGLKVQVVTDANVIHLGGGSIPNAGWAKKKLAMGKARYYKKHFSAIGARLDLLMLISWFSMRTLLAHNKSIRRANSALVRHYVSTWVALDLLN